MNTEISENYWITMLAFNELFMAEERDLKGLDFNTPTDKLMLNLIRADKYISLEDWLKPVIAQAQKDNIFSFEWKGSLDRLYEILYINGGQSFLEMLDYLKEHIDEYEDEDQE